MASSAVHRKSPSEPTFDVRHFVVPAHYPQNEVEYDKADVCAIIPTYAPEEMTLRLVRDLVRWNPRVRVYVVDDCTPSSSAIAELFRNIASISDTVTVLRTPENKLKAGALNYALAHMAESGLRPDVILTIDDDVMIAPETVKNLVTELLEGAHLGAACSQCRVYNKNTNLLTRLQGLEYLGFNAIRLSDEGFYRGPLVMHGMLTAFRAFALLDAGGFREGHLIEDYEITTQLKARGWSVKSVQSAPAWTLVPETFFRFWRQRTRWSYGGITVVARARPLAVFQDILGHAMFLSMLAIVGALLFLKGNGNVPPGIANAIIVLSFAQFGIWYIFQLFLMRHYEERDAHDWALRIAFLPEFIYGYVMTFALVGSYLFHSFVVFTAYFNLASHRPRLTHAVRRFFRSIGYTERAWGTRHVSCAMK